eukprot:CAMPEP_0114261002 /NCGR_PEP_ID=MMETSP0058-20121206/20853_1 /TAXON_ID=36894 /ORGANISM="Pyramimonas parkeae, CCMP726" /LENGTH=120 /DNA_ID=CAMNT_0001376405 /DNA_START=132 /DNA_END=494 /DNA_ORIENTATION=-
MAMVCRQKLELMAKQVAALGYSVTWASGHALIKPMKGYESAQPLQMQINNPVHPRGTLYSSGQEVEDNKLQWQLNHCPSKINWTALPGRSDEERIYTLFALEEPQETVEHLKSDAAMNTK